MAKARKTDPAEQAHMLSEALPHMQRYDEEIIVIKYGGHAMGDEKTAKSFARDIVLMEQTAINPVVGLTTFLAQYVLRKPLIKSNTQEFRVQGTWKDPKVHKVDATTDSKPGAAESKP